MIASEERLKLLVKERGVENTCPLAQTPYICLPAKSTIQPLIPLFVPHSALDSPLYALLWASLIMFFTVWADVISFWFWVNLPNPAIAAVTNKVSTVMEISNSRMVNALLAFSVKRKAFR